MTEENEIKWRLNRKVTLSSLVQVLLLASLIIGSWLNLQRQLDLLQRDVALLLRRHEEYKAKMEHIAEEIFAHEYRLRSLEVEERDEK